MSETIQAIYVLEGTDRAPSVGAYVVCPYEGSLYRVTEVTSDVQANRYDAPRAVGGSNWCRVLVEPADWSDCAEGDEAPGSLLIEA